MRNLVMISAGLVMALGVVSTSLWRDLRHERQVNVVVRSQLTEARAMPRLTRPPPVVVAAQAPAPVAAAPTAALPACKPVPERAALPAPPPPAEMIDAVRMAAQGNQVTERDLLKDPEYRKARLAQRRLDMQRSNPGVGDALGLSEKEADKFLDLLADYQLRMNEQPAPGTTDPRAANLEMTTRRQALQKDQDAAILGLLGANGVAQWQEYQQTRSGRTQAVSMGSQLLQMGLPLTSAQMKPLTTALVAEQQRQRQESANMVRNINPAGPQARAALQEESQRRNAESNRRILAAVSGSLTPQQVAVLRQQFESQETLTRVSNRARGRTPAPGAP